MYDYNYFDFQAADYLAKQTEKKRIKKAANAVGVACILTAAVNFILSMIVGAVLGFAGKLDILEDPYFLNIFQIIASVVMFIPAYFITAKVMGIKVSRACAFGGVKEKGLITTSLTTGYGVCVIASMVGGIISAFLSSIGLESEVDIPLPDGVFGFLLSVIATAVIPALVEEFAFRGIVLTLFKPFGDGFAILLSGIMFGLIHGNMAQIPFAIIVGVALSYITVRTGSIWVSVGLHFINNFMSVVLNYLIDKVTVIPEELVSSVWLFGTVILSVLGILVLNHRGKKLIEVKPADTLLTNREKFKAVFSTPGVIISIIVVALEVLMNMTV